MSKFILNHQIFKKQLSREEEIECFKLLSQGDKNARNKLIEHNLRMVIYIINTYFQNFTINNPIIDSDDFMSAGIWGLIKAVDSFDVDRGNTFASYACRCIENEILMLLRNIIKDKKNVSFYEIIKSDNDGNNLTLSDIINDGEDIFEIYEKIETKIIVSEALKILTEQERLVIYLHYYGINGKRLTEQEIGVKIGCLKPNVCKIENRAKNKLAEYLIDQGEGNIKKVTPEMELLKNMSSKEKTLFYVNNIVRNNVPIEELARKCNVKVSVIKTNISKNLPKLDMELYIYYCEIIKKEERERSLKKKLKLENISHQD